MLFYVDPGSFEKKKSCRSKKKKAASGARQSSLFLDM